MMTIFPKGSVEEGPSKRTPLTNATTNNGDAANIPRRRRPSRFLRILRIALEHFCFTYGADNRLFTNFRIANREAEPFARTILIYFHWSDRKRRIDCRYICSTLTTSETTECCVPTGTCLQSYRCALRFKIAVLVS